MKKMKMYLLSILIWESYAQYATEIHSISKCLNNCGLCENNELDACVGDFFEMCIPNYGMHSMDGHCIIDSIYQEQLVLISHSGETPISQHWKKKPTTQCFFERSNKQIQNINILGLFEASAQNELVLPVKPHYQNMIVSFNLVRNSWIPYMDFMLIQIKDNANKIIGKHIIEYLQRPSQYPPQINTVRCNNQKLILQKFQIDVDFRHNNISKITIAFKGLMQGEELWGFTDFKVAFGCQNNLYFNGQDCFNCQTSFYLDEDNLVNESPTCHACTSNCKTCSKNACQICADNMVPDGVNCVAAPGFKLYDKVYQPSQHVCQINMLHSFSDKQTGKQLIQSIIVEVPNQHMNARLIFDLYLTDTQWSNESALIIQVDGKEIKRIRENAIHNRLRQKCDQFKDGIFSHQRIITPYFQHFDDKLRFRIYSADKAITDFGISDVSVLVELDFAPRPKQPQINPVPTPTPIRVQNTTVKNNATNIANVVEVNTTNTTNVTNTNTSKQKQIITPVKPVPQQPVHAVDEQQIILKKETISQIKQIKNEVVISHNRVQQDEKNGEILISINYPIQVKNYPYIYCHFLNSNMQLPAKMVSSTNHLQIVAVQITKSILQQTVVFYMSAYQKAVSRRGLQDNQQPDQIELGRLKIKRYDVLDITQVSGLGSLRVFFLTITWIFLILTIIMMMMGKGSLITELSNLLQIIFLHIYINGQYLPLTFKTPISGLANMENLNYFIDSTQFKIQKWLLGNVVQESPLRFTQFTTDINFSRAIYPIVIINLVFAIWFGILKVTNLVLKSNLQRTKPKQIQQYRSTQQNQSFAQKLNVHISKIVNRPINFWYFVLKYQFLAVIWISLLQFFNLSYPKDADRNQTINAIYCIFSFIATLAWPVIAYLLFKHYYHVLEYSEYIHSFEDIFYFQLYQRSLPSNHHQYYILLGKLRLILYAICCSFLGNSPIQALTILISIHIVSIVYLKFARPILDTSYRRMCYVQFGLLIVLELLIVIGYGIGEVVTKNTYFSLGYLMIATCLLLIANALARVVYTIYRIKTEKHDDKTTFKGELATERVV